MTQPREDEQAGPGLPQGHVPSGQASSGRRGFIARGDRLVSRLELVLGGIMLAGVALNLVNVFSRYVLGSPVFWAEEVLIVLMVWGVFLGAVAVAWNGEHLSMDLFVSFLRGRARQLINLFTALSFIAVCLFAVLQSWTILEMFVQTGAVSVGAQIPRYIPHAALLAGFGLMALVVALRMRAYLSGRFKDEP